MIEIQQQAYKTRFQNLMNFIDDFNVVDIEIYGNYASVIAIEKKGTFKYHLEYNGIVNCWVVKSYNLI